ncbi:hypothetical protein A2154_02710 [Candidatus Gottesmanbacteria bacterium RBG_16_43_7]|uniref:Uncharacterized protein n=1 Tax=Candidatus Gottesmanbacteria bacterium RBG_16_43_7 TaxID=1798373 RepID=A0A1F5Z920_9BACT|nr:MAG: hypothetical protein A2154_02710 [Candidatus Gottesmanbacteria bacterium RBG_16_43_7]
MKGKLIVVFLLLAMVIVVVVPAQAADITDETPPTPAGDGTDATNTVEVSQPQEPSSFGPQTVHPGGILYYTALNTWPVTYWNSYAVYLGYFWTRVYFRRGFTLVYTQDLYLFDCMDEVVTTVPKVCALGHGVVEYSSTNPSLILTGIVYIAYLPEILNRR